MSTAAFCIATSETQAQNLTSALRQSGFPSNGISVLFPDRTGTRDLAQVQQSTAPAGAVAGVGTGGAIGGAVGWMVGLGALAIPGVGPFFAAGPLLALLAGAAVGAAVGGIAGTLIGQGVPADEAKRYAGRITAGDILVAVHADSAAEVDKAKAIFRDGDAQDITATGEAMAAPDQAESERGRLAARSDEAPGLQTAASAG